ncbi:MAG: hypothetical protein ACYC27_08570 [Armatimonadota bacterium]
MTNRNPGGATTGNTNAVKHGVYTKRFISSEERDLYNLLLTRFMGDYPHIDDSILKETVLCTMRLNPSFKG